MKLSGDVVFIAIGGAVGAVTRYGVGELLPSTSFPWATFVVNIVGCALLALVSSPTRTRSQRRILGVGFCGGLTTFSTFTVEVASLTNDGRSTLAIVYLLASLAAGFVAFAAVSGWIQPGPQAPPTPSAVRRT